MRNLFEKFEFLCFQPVQTRRAGFIGANHPSLQLPMIVDIVAGPVAALRGRRDCILFHWRNNSDGSEEIR